MILKIDTDEIKHIIFKIHKPIRYQYSGFMLEGTDGKPDTRQAFWHCLFCNKLMAVEYADGSIKEV